MSEEAEAAPTTSQPRKKAATAKVEVAFDPELADAYGKAVEARDGARNRRDADPTNSELVRELAVLEDAVVDAETALRPTVVTYTFRALGGDAFEDLQDDPAHQPTKDQRATARKRGLPDPTWNGDTFPQALIAASLIDPPMTVEQVQSEIWDSPEWNEGERLDLFWAALGVQRRRRTDLGKGYGQTPS